MSTSQRVAKNFLSLSLAEVVVRLSGTVLSVFAARLLGVSAFGELAFATAFVSFFNIFSDFGLTTLGTRDIAQEKTRTHLYGSTILLFQVVLSLVLLATVIGLSFLLPLSPRAKLIVIVSGLVLIPTAFNMAYIFQAHERMEYVTLSRVVGQLVYVLIGFALLWKFRDIIYVPVASFVGLMIAAGLIWFWLRRKVDFHWQLMDKAQLIKLLRDTMPFLIAALAIQIYYNFDSIFLQFVRGEMTVGLYSSAYKIVLLMITIGGFLHGAFFPLLSSVAGQDEVVVKRAVKEWARIAGSLAFPIAFGGVLLAEPIMSLIYGHQFTSASSAFAILITLPLLIFINGIMSGLLIAHHQQKSNTIGVVLGALINLLLNLVLIPAYGMIGAAIATVAAEAVVSIYLWRAYNHTIAVPLWSTYISKPLIASLGMSICLLAIKQLLPLPIIILAGGAVYAILLILIGGVTLTDIRSILDRSTPSIE